MIAPLDLSRMARPQYQTQKQFMENIVKLHTIAASLMVAACLSANVHADETRTEGLNLELTPYFWAAGVDGKVSARGQEVNFDRDFSDLIENVDTAFMMLGVLSYNRFVLYADYDYMNLTDDAKTRRGILFPVGTKVNGEVDLDVGTYGGGYRFDTFRKNTIDVLVGAQLTDIETKFKVAGLHFDEKNNLTDTVIMLRPSFQLSERWRFNPTFAYGVSGDSDTTYSMMPQLQYQFSDSFAARFGYKKLHYEFDEDGDNEIDLSGLFLGVGWTFPPRPEKVAARHRRRHRLRNRPRRCRRASEVSRRRQGWRVRCRRPMSEYARRRARGSRWLRLRLRSTHPLRLRFGRTHCGRQNRARPVGDGAEQSRSSTS